MIFDSFLSLATEEIIFKNRVNTYNLVDFILVNLYVIFMIYTFINSNLQEEIIDFCLLIFRYLFQILRVFIYIKRLNNKKKQYSSMKNVEIINVEDLKLENDKSFHEFAHLNVYL